MKLEDSYPFPNIKTNKNSLLKFLDCAVLTEECGIKNWEYWKILQYNKNEQKKDKVHIEILQKISK